MRFAATAVLFCFVTTAARAQNKSCQVLSAGEINSALGTHFTKSQAEPEREGRMNCVYGDPDGDQNVRVAVANHIGAADFKKEIIVMNGDNPAPTKPLPGLGDQAEILEIPPSVTGVFARQGRTVVAVVVVGLPTQQAKAEIDKLIRVAFSRL